MLETKNRFLPTLLITKLSCCNLNANIVTINMMIGHMVILKGEI